MEGFPSGQREQTVNLSALPSKVRILLPPPYSNRLNIRAIDRDRKDLRVSYIGITLAFQANETGSIPVTRSKMESINQVNCSPSSVGRVLPW